MCSAEYNSDFADSMCGQLAVWLHKRAAGSLRTEVKQLAHRKPMTLTFSAMTFLVLVKETHVVDNN